MSLEGISRNVHAHVDKYVSININYMLLEDYLSLVFLHNNFLRSPF